jgi:hypothetical protein
MEHRLSYQYISQCFLYVHLHLYIHLNNVVEVHIQNILPFFLFMKIQGEKPCFQLIRGRSINIIQRVRAGTRTISRQNKGKKEKKN